MAEKYSIHSVNPENRKINNLALEISDGAVVLFPTDSGFSLCCNLGDKAAIKRIRQIRNLREDQSMTFICGSLEKISMFAKVSNEAYKTIKALTPGPYTFILPASKEVPKFAQNPKRKTAGIRVPNSNLVQDLVDALDHPLIAISAKMDEVDFYTEDDVIEKYHKLVDIVVETNEYNFTGESTIIDMESSETEFSVLREGAGMEKVNDLLI